MEYEKSIFLKNDASKNSISFSKKITYTKTINFFLTYVFIIFLFLTILIILALKKLGNNYKQNFDKVFNDNNYFPYTDYYENTNEKIEALKKGQKFFNICMEGKLIFGIPKDNEIKENFLISVVIPIYNTEDKIKSVLRSIQNQNFSNIEIILVNDFSNNETSRILQDLQKEDKRIIIINNKENMGTLYSRSIGTLKARGKYIFPLDNDDLFFDEGLFHIISNEAEKGNFDIVEFRGSSRNIYELPPNSFTNTNYSNHKNGLILFQPELGQYATNKGNQFGVYDCFLWAKCIRSIVYKTTINYLGRDIYSKKIIWGEDLITSFVLFKVAKSFKFIGRYGIFRYLNTSTATYHTSDSKIILSKIIYLYIILKFTENNFQDKKYVSFRAIGFMRAFQKLNLDKNNLLYLNKIAGMIIKNEYIYTSDKNKIKLILTGIISSYRKLI